MAKKVLLYNIEKASLNDTKVQKGVTLWQKGVLLWQNNLLYNIKGVTL